MDYFLIILIGFFFFILFGINPFFKNHEPFTSINKFFNSDATQAVAIGQKHFYAISNKSISKCKKSDGQIIDRWVSSIESMHLNSGVIVGKYLLCANNPPFENIKISHEKHLKRPITNIDTIEIFNHKTMEHVRTIYIKMSGLLRLGSFTWIDFYEDNWWGAFAFYGNFAKYTTLVRFTIDWKNDKIKILEKWEFPKKIIKNFYPYSNSGCSIKDDIFYCTGHDKKEIYLMKFDKNRLLYSNTIPSKNTGQGISWDRYTDKNILYTIDRKNKMVIAQSL